MTDTESSGPETIQPNARQRPWMAEPMRRLRTYLTDAYPRTATNALVQLLAILLGFMVGTSWSIRESERRELAGNLEILTPWQEEVQLLSKQAEALQRNPPNLCILAFETPRWEDMVRSGYRLRLKSDLYRQARLTYSDIALAPGRGKGMGLERCQLLIADLGKRIDDLGRLLDQHVDNLKAEESRLISLLTTRGLIVYVVAIMTLGAVVLLLPLFVYWMGIIAIRVVR